MYALWHTHTHTHTFANPRLSKLMCVVCALVALVVFVVACCLPWLLWLAYVLLYALKWKASGHIAINGKRKFGLKDQQFWQVCHFWGTSAKSFENDKLAKSFNRLLVVVHFISVWDFFHFSMWFQIWIARSCCGRLIW